MYKKVLLLLFVVLSFSVSAAASEYPPFPSDLKVPASATSFNPYTKFFISYVNTYYSKSFAFDCSEDEARKLTIELRRSIDSSVYEQYFWQTFLKYKKDTGLSPYLIHKELQDALIKMCEEAKANQ